MDRFEQTRKTFSDKWQKNKSLAFAQTLDESSDIFRWIVTRNGFADARGLSAYLSGFSRILDAGCGNGRATALLRKYSAPAAEIVGVDLTAASVARENLAGLPGVRIEQGDLLGDLSSLGEFDFIYCQEVLHHTSDPKAAFINLCKRLTKGGEIAIYVYKKKAPVREYVDDYIRNKISGLSYDESIAVMRQITEFGRSLAAQGVRIQVPAVDVLEIEAGEYEVQRLIYYFFMKCFWNGELRFDENVAINYDWYQPQLCTRHTLPEVLGWFEDAGLSVVHTTVDHYGITVRGKQTGHERGQT